MRTWRVTDFVGLGVSQPQPVSGAQKITYGQCSKYAKAGAAGWGSSVSRGWFGSTNTTYYCCFTQDVISGKPGGGVIHESGTCEVITDM